MVDDLDHFLVEVVESWFRRYVGFGARIDDAYECAMRPFIRVLP